MRRQAALLAVALVAGLTGCSDSEPPEAASAVAAPSASTTPTGNSAAAHNAVTRWASIVAPAVHSAAEPRPPVSSEVLHTVVHLSVYDAVVAIEGGFESFGNEIEAPAGANLDAAVATAAHRAARGRVAPTQFGYLDREYDAFLAAIPDGPAKTDGVGVGTAAADGILALRADDGYATAVAYTCEATPPPTGEFAPNAGCGTEPVDAKIAQVKPFTFDDPARFRPDGPEPFTAARWVTDFDEVKAYGRADSTVRTAEQTDIVQFWAEHTYVHWNRNLIGLAAAEDLDTLETARLFAMAHTAAADAAIAGFEAKYFFRAWRPRTAIPGAADDGNPTTEPEAGWTPLLSVDHPEYPSAHAFFSTALTEAVATFFGTDELRWTLVTSKEAVPKIVRTERSFATLGAILDEVGDARVFAGLHFRSSIDDGAALGRRVAAHVLSDNFRPVA